MTHTRDGILWTRVIISPLSLSRPKHPLSFSRVSATTRLHQPATPSTGDSDDDLSATTPTQRLILVNLTSSSAAASSSHTS
ncbi:hypothetical protein YC2023_102131 [Brassica napus]